MPGWWGGICDTRPTLVIVIFDTPYKWARRWRQECRSEDSRQSETVGIWRKNARRARPLEFSRERAARMEQDNCRQRSGEAKLRWESSCHTVTYRWLFTHDHNMAGHDDVGSSGFSRNFGSSSSVVHRSHSWRALIFSESSCSFFPTVSVCEINVRSQKLVRVNRGRQINWRLRLAIIHLHVSLTPFMCRLSVDVTLLQFMSGKNFIERDCSYTMWWFVTEQLIPCNLELSNQWTSPANLVLQRPALVDPCIIVATRRPVPACLGKPTAVGSMMRSNSFHMHRCKSCFYLLK
jgi:hypothetical protein